MVWQFLVTHVRKHYTFQLQGKEPSELPSSPSSSCKARDSIYSFLLIRINWLQMPLYRTVGGKNHWFKGFDRSYIVPQYANTSVY